MSDATVTTNGKELGRLQNQAKVSAEDVLAFYDTLAAAQLPEVLGSWKGAGLHTGHPMDGLLETFGWHGKRFESIDNADPLVFKGRHVPFAVNPALVPMKLAKRALPQSALSAAAFPGRALLRLCTTKKPRARLRMVEHRGVSSATMLYDALPIVDHFRRVDEDTLLGVMDYREIPDPFFFVLRREFGGQGVR